jgi:hypothetical protein
MNSSKRGSAFRTAYGGESKERIRAETKVLMAGIGGVYVVGFMLFFDQRHRSLAVAAH